MIAIGSETELYLLEFVDRRGLEREVERLRKRTKAAILPGEIAPIQSIRQELQAYFEGKLTQFKTPLHLLWAPLFNNKSGSPYKPSLTVKPALIRN